MACSLVNSAMLILGTDPAKRFQVQWFDDCAETIAVIVQLWKSGFPQTLMGEKSVRCTDKRVVFPSTGSPPAASWHACVIRVCAGCVQGEPIVTNSVVW